MLKLLRKKGVMKKLLWFVAVIIIISFGLFGTANYLSKRRVSVHAGTIFGQKISLDDFQTSLLHARDQAILFLGYDFYKMQDYLDLENAAWDRLILLHEANKRRIKVNNKDVVDAITDIGLFKRDGQFDQDVYNKILRYVFRRRPREFEESIRESLMISKLFDQETLLVSASDEDVLQEYKNRNEQIQVSYILFPVNDYIKDVSVDPNEAEAYYIERRGEFYIPPTINLEYIHLKYPEKSESDAPEQSNEIAQKAQDVFQDAQSTSDLHATAEKFGLEVKESGPFNENQPNLKIGWSFQLLQKAFSLKEGELSEPIETPQGYYILKLKEKKDSYIPPFEEVKQKVNNVVKIKKARLLATTKAQDTLKATKDILSSNPQISFKDLAKQLGLTATQTPLFTRRQYVDKIGDEGNFRKNAFGLNEQNKLSNVVTIAKGYCILHFDTFVPIEEQKYTGEKEVLRQELFAQQKEQAKNNLMIQLRIKANLDNNIARLREMSQQAK